MPADLSLITAMIPNYKTLDLLQVCLEGLIACYPSLDILLLDNGSNDASTTYIEKMAREVPKISAILNRPNPNPPEPPDPCPIPGPLHLNQIWGSGNVGNGPAVHQVFSLCQTPYLFTLDTDCKINKCGFLEKMLKYFDDPTMYAVGYLYSGPRSLGLPIQQSGVSHIHASIALFDVAKYKTLCPFVHSGVISKENFRDAQRKGYKVADFPVGGKARGHPDDYIDHFWFGSRKRLKRFPHLRSKPLESEIMLYGLRTEYIGRYFN